MLGQGGKVNISRNAIARGDNLWLVSKENYRVGLGLGKQQI